MVWLSRSAHWIQYLISSRSQEPCLCFQFLLLMSSGWGTKWRAFSFFSSLFQFIVFLHCKILNSQGCRGGDRLMSVLGIATFPIIISSLSPLTSATFISLNPLFSCRLLLSRFLWFLIFIFVIFACYKMLEGQINWDYNTDIQHYHLLIWYGNLTVYLHIQQSIYQAKSNIHSLLALFHVSIRSWGKYPSL